MKRNKQNKKKTQPKQKQKKQDSKDTQKQNQKDETKEPNLNIKRIRIIDGEIIEDSQSLYDQQSSVTPSPSSSNPSSSFNSYTTSPAFPQQSPSIQISETPRERSPMEVLTDENHRNLHQIELITKQIDDTIDTTISDIQKEEKKLVNLLGKSHEHLSNEIRYSFDSDSVIMDMPYVRKPMNVDSLIQLKKEKDDEMKQLLNDLNELFIDCIQRLDHIDEMKSNLFHSIENYNQSTERVISLIHNQKSSDNQIVNSSQVAEQE